MCWPTGFLFLFSKTLGLVPAFGVDEVAGYIGPVLVIGAFPLSFITRLTRTSLVEVQQQDYIRTARSKGISEFKVIYKHALRNALLPGGDLHRAHGGLHCHRLLCH